MTGSAEKATEVVGRLKKIGADTPFELTDVANATQLLMNYGFEAENAIDSMMMLGDISQGNADKMNIISTAYGQMSSAGKVMLQDVKQMIEAGFNPLQEISESTGESMDSLYDRISKGTISVDEITASMKRSTSEGGKYFKSMEEQSKTVNGRLSTLSDTVKNKLGEAFGSVSEFIRSMLPNVISFIENLDVNKVLNGFKLLVGVLGGLLATIVSIRGAIKLFNIITFIKNIGGLSSAFGVLGVNIGAVLTTIGPVVAIALAVIAVIVIATKAIKDLCNTNEDFRNAVLDAWKSIQSTLSSVWNSVLKPIFESITKFMMDIYNNGIKPLWDRWVDFIGNIAIKMSGLLKSIQPVVDFMVSIFGPIITGVLDEVLGAFSTVFNAISNLMIFLIENIEGAINWAITVFQGIIDFLVGVFTADWDLAWQGIVGIFGDVFNTIVDIAKGPINLVIGLINGMISAVESGINYVVRAVNRLSFKVPDWVPFIGGETFGFDMSEITLGKIPHLERGGILKKGQMGLLEGNGAEAVIPLDRNKHWIKAMSKEMLKYMPQTISQTKEQVVNFYQPVQTPDEMARALRLEQRYGLMGG